MSERPAVIIPVYRDAESTRRCVESVAAAKAAHEFEIIIINDASPVDEITEYCRAIDQSKIRLVENPSNLGFVKSVNIGMRLAGNADVILLNSDTVVPDGWLDRMLAVANTHPRAASVTPFSNNATICSYPNFCEDNELPANSDHVSIDRLFAQANAGCTAEIPTAVGFCMYLRRAAINQVGEFDEDAFGRGYGEENDWCMRASALGWQHLLCANLFVYHAGGASFGDEAAACQENALAVISKRYPEYNAMISNFIAEDPLEPLRHQVDLLRPDVAAVLSETRQRAISERRARQVLDQQRHEQVESLGRLLTETRQSAEAERANFESLISSQRAEHETAEHQYLLQIREMAEGYEQLNNAYIQLQLAYEKRRRMWAVRVVRALMRALGRDAT